MSHLTLKSTLSGKKKYHGLMQLRSQVDTAMSQGTIEGHRVDLFVP